MIQQGISSRVVSFLSFTLIALGSFQPAMATGAEQEQWLTFEASATEYSALSEQIFETVISRMETAPDGREKANPAFLRQIERENRQLDHTFHRLQNELDQSRASAAQAASYRTANRRERRLLLNRLRGLIQEFERTEEGMADLDEHESQTDQILQLRMRNSRIYHLVRGFVDVPRRCESKPLDYVRPLLDKAREEALLQPLTSAQFGDAAQLLESFSWSASTVPGQAVLKLRVTPQVRTMAPLPQQGQDTLEVLESGADGGASGAQNEPAIPKSENPPGAEGESNADTADGARLASSEEVDRVFLLALLEMKVSSAEGAEDNPLEKRESEPTDGCGPSALAAEAKLLLQDSPDTSPHWPETWRLADLLEAEDLEMLDEQNTEILEFWRSLDSGLNSTFQRGWVDAWQAAHDVIGRERAAVREARSTLAAEITRLDAWLRATTTTALASEQDQSHLDTLREREQKLHEALSSGLIALQWPATFRAPDQNPKGVAVPDLEKSLKQAESDARKRYSAKIAPYLDRIDSSERYVVARLENFLPLVYERSSTGSDGKRPWNLEIALKFKIRLIDGLLTPREFFTAEDRRRLAEFLPSEEAPSAIVDRLVWEVPADKTRALTWFQADDFARELPASYGCSTWRLPSLEELKTIARPEAEKCTIFPELGLECGDRVWASERMGQSDNYLALTFGRPTSGSSSSPRPGFNASTNIKVFAVCEPDWSDLDDLPELPAGVAELVPAEELARESDS